MVVIHLEARNNSRSLRLPSSTLSGHHLSILSLLHFFLLLFPGPSPFLLFDSFSLDSASLLLLLHQPSPLLCSQELGFFLAHFLLAQKM